MRTKGERMIISLRRILAETHVAAVAIAIFLIWSLDSFFQALWWPLFRAVSYLLTAIAILDVPYFSFNRSQLLIALLNLSNAFIDFAAAWLLSRWVYREGPFRSLSNFRVRFFRRNHV
jgi:hypothetical protein